jgi:hypothetical protein
VSAVYLVEEAIVDFPFDALATYPPDIEYADQMRAAQTFARDNHPGLWCRPVTAAMCRYKPPCRSRCPRRPRLRLRLRTPKRLLSRNGNCDPAFLSACIPSPPDLDCGSIPYRHFTALPPDQHRFDGANDGIGYESGRGGAELTDSDCSRPFDEFSSENGDDHGLYRRD